MLQNLDGKVEGWESWWSSIQTELRADSLLKFFNRLRTEILHAGRVHVTMRMLAPVPAEIGQEVGPRPVPTAKLVVSGLRGWFWVWRDDTGQVQELDIPWPEKSCGPKRIVFVSKGTATLPPEHLDTDVADLCDKYLDAVENVVERTFKQFPPKAGAEFDA